MFTIYDFFFLKIKLVYACYVYIRNFTCDVNAKTYNSLTNGLPKHSYITCNWCVKNSFDGASIIIHTYTIVIYSQVIYSGVPITDLTHTRFRSNFLRVRLGDAMKLSYTLNYCHARAILIYNSWSRCRKLPPFRNKTKHFQNSDADAVNV